MPTWPPSGATWHRATRAGVVIYGRSLGTGLAAQLAADVQPDLTVPVSPYASIEGLARELYPWVLPQLLRCPLRTDLIVPRLRGPLLLLHGDRDEIIPFHESRKLQALAPQAKLVRIAGGGHNDLHHLPDYQQAVTEALR